MSYCSNHLLRLKPLLWGGAFWATLLISGLIYSLGLEAGLQFDDEANLQGLANIHDFDSAVSFIFNGVAGPLGRPLALLSFAPQYYAWPHSPQLMTGWNICLHLLNGSLVTWLALRLSAITSLNSSRQPVSIAVLTGALWLLSPLLVSSSLLIIQRMTTLSALFVFAGLLCYLCIRLRAVNKPEHHIISLGLVVVVFTCLAAFTKENGILFPLYVLVVEITLLAVSRYRSAHRIWKAWQAVFLYLPLLIIIFYLITRVPYSENVVLQRDFTVPSRLAAQGYIIWTYLFRAFFPTPSALGPFHDVVWQLEPDRIPLGLVLFAGVLIIAGAAVCYRKRYPLLAFAVLWYLLGHILESTTIPLELYFEHRNYVPLVGPFFAFVASLVSVQQSKKMLRFFIIAYLALMAGVTSMETSLWGQPLLAAEMWALDNPKSVRASLQLAKQLEKENDLSSALHALDRFNTDNPISIGLQIQAVKVACVIDPEGDHAERLSRLVVNAPHTRYESWASEQPEHLHAWLLKHACKGIDFNTVDLIANLMINHERYSTNRIVLHNLYALKAIIAWQNDNIAQSFDYFDTALSRHINQTTLQTSLMLAYQFKQQQFIDKWLEHAQ